MSLTNCLSWICGTFEIPEVSTGEIVLNVDLDFIHFPYIPNFGEFTAQGDEARKIITEIHTIWNEGNFTQSEAIKKYVFANF